MGVALAVWGFAIGMPVAGLVLGAILEAARFAPPSERAASRVSLVLRIVVLAALAKLAYVAVTSSFPQALYTWLRWLPVILMPLPLAHALAKDRDAPADAPLARWVPPSAETMLVYACVTLVAAATGSSAGAWFYLAAAGIVGWILAASIAPARRLAGAAMLAAGIAAGYGVHTGLSVLQGNVEEWSTEMLQDYFAASADPFKERTRIGDLGRVKLSDRIVMRVTPDGPRPPTLLLREAAFDRYYNGEWQAARRVFQAVPRDGERWKLRDGSEGARLSVRRSIPGGEGLLPLPAGARLVDRLPAERVEAMPTGAVRARGAPRFVSIAVTYDEAGESDPPVAATDLEVSSLTVPVLDRVLAAEKLVRATPAETLAAIERYFGDKFSYSLNLSQGKDGGTRTLADFLLRDHKGHCEYFATGTALLLRRAGIPARYTVGYSAQEYSDLERAFIVRSRHAHAWTSAYIDGRWIAVDTTPARWADAEGEAARSVLGPMLDLASWFVEEALQAWLAKSAHELAWMSVMVVGFLVLAPFSFLIARRIRRRDRRRGVPSPVTRAWLALEKRVAREGFAREDGETALGWARRLRRENQFEAWRGDLVRLTQAYYQARFDPAATGEAREAFVREARQWRGKA
jgi:hypothetical protein